MKPTSNNTIRPILIGITGGIGSGKSYICHQLEQTGHHVFYCDDVAKQIIRTQADVKRELTALVGLDVYDAAGQLVKEPSAFRKRKRGFFCNLEKNKRKRKYKWSFSNSIPPVF